MSETLSCEQNVLDSGSNIPIFVMPIRSIDVTNKTIRLNVSAELRTHAMNATLPSPYIDVIEYETLEYVKKVKMKMSCIRKTHLVI